MDTNDKTSALYEQTMDFTKLSPEDLARVTTRDGRRVEIITTKGREPRPVVGYLQLSTSPHAWGADGNCGSILPSTQSNYDLILPPAPNVFYFNKYEHVIGSQHTTVESARRGRGYDWLALYKIVDNGVTATIEVIERNETSNRNP